ncbi:MAG TPA: hypothetical protein VF038_05300 [Usitatibacter sp.]|jgi:hypothetical protein
MSNAPNAVPDGIAPSIPFGRAVVPMLVAAGAVTLALAVVRAQPSEAPPPEAAQPAAEGSPYSEMHRHVQESPGDPEPLPPQF